MSDRNTASEPTHTPGPWGVQLLDPTNPAGWWEVTPEIAMVNATENRAKQGESNARLMAAAPDLLAALKELADFGEAYMKYHTEKFYPGDHLPPPTGLWPFIRAARSAIAKAEGR